MFELRLRDVQPPVTLELAGRGLLGSGSADWEGVRVEAGAVGDP